MISSFTRSLGVSKMLPESSTGMGHHLATELAKTGLNDRIWIKKILRHWLIFQNVCDCRPSRWKSDHIFWPFLWHRADDSMCLSSELLGSSLGQNSGSMWILFVQSIAILSSSKFRWSSFTVLYTYTWEGSLSPLDTSFLRAEALPYSVLCHRWPVFRTVTHTHGF